MSNETLPQTLAGWMPDGAIPVACIAVMEWLDPTTGESHWRSAVDSELPVTANLGLLDLAKLDIVVGSDTGLPIRYGDDE